MNTTPPKTNSAPSQMTSILASTSLYSPNPLAPAPYHQFSKAGQSRQQPSRGSPEASCECGRNCSACSGAQRIRRDFRASLRTDAYRDQTPKEVARPQQCRRRRPFRLHSTPPSNDPTAPYGSPRPGPCGRRCAACDNNRRPSRTSSRLDPDSLTSKPRARQSGWKRAAYAEPAGQAFHDIRPRASQAFEGRALPIGSALWQRAG